MFMPDGRFRASLGISGQLILCFKGFHIVLPVTKPVSGLMDAIKEIYTDKMQLFVLGWRRLGHVMPMPDGRYRASLGISGQLILCLKGFHIVLPVTKPASGLMDAINEIYTGKNATFCLRVATFEACICPCLTVVIGHLWAFLGS